MVLLSQLSDHIFVKIQADFYLISGFAKSIIYRNLKNSGTRDGTSMKTTTENGL